VLDFEATAVTDWSVIQSGPATLAVSSTACQGFRSLAVSSHGYVPVQSVALSSLGSRVGSAIHYDIMLPSQLKQVSPYWYGTTQLFLTAPSVGLNTKYLGQLELTPLPVGQWSTLTFTPPPEVLTALRGSYTDLQVTIVVNAPYNATQPYLLDNLRFSDSTLALVRVVDASGQPISGLTVVSYNGSTPAGSTGVTDSTGLAKLWVPPGSYRFGVTDAGVTTYSGKTNHCHVPGICAAATIVDKCHNVVCTPSDNCHTAGTCQPDTGQCSNPSKPVGTVCRAAAGPCDLAEVCDGTDAGCPADQLAPPATVCRVSTGPCDGAETCTGSDPACPPDAPPLGGGYVGPGETCAPATPVTPGPFGDFRCLLEEVPTPGKNVLSLGTGAATEAWILRGSMGFSFTEEGAKLTKLSVTGQKTRTSLQQGIVLAFDRSSTSSGIVDMTSGNLQVTLPVLIIRPDGTSTAVSLSLAGRVADRVVQGTAAASGGISAHASIFCREQFRDTVASVIFKIDGTGNFVDQGPVSIFRGTPTMPESRSIPAQGNMIAELAAATGEILDQYDIGQPWTGQDSSAGGFTLASGPTTIELEVRAPLSNRIASVALRSATGSTVALADLRQAITGFCAGAGSQYCDYSAGTPVRKVLYAPGTPAPALNPSFPPRTLPSSPRLTASEVVLSTDYMQRQPSVALDADGNLIVVWRNDYSDIMAKGISKTGATLFGPVTVNDKPCIYAWVPGYPPPDEIIEYGQSVSARPVVAVSNTARDASGAADRTFAVAWGGWADLSWKNGKYVTVYFMCSRLMNGDGTPVEDPYKVPLAPASDDATVRIERDTYLSVAITESHDYVVTWDEIPSDTGNSRVAAMAFGANGRPKLPQSMVVSDESSQDSLRPTVAMDSTGRTTIAWRKNIPNANGRGYVWIQRFSNTFSKLGSPMKVGQTSIRYTPAVAMRPANGDIIVAAHSHDKDVYSGVIKFSDGTVADAFSKTNARASGSQERPVVAATGNGGYLVAWMDEAGAGSSLINPISAVIYDSGGRPLDIDFTISTTTPLYTKNETTNPDFFFLASGFAFSAAGSEKDYVVAWQRPTVNLGTNDDPNWIGGMMFQRFDGGAAPCPAPTECGTAIPLRISGATEDKIDIILSPGAVWDESTKKIEDYFTKPYESAAEFGRKAVDLIVNGYMSNNLYSTYWDQFNFYYETVQATPHMEYNGLACALKGFKKSTGRDSTNAAYGYKGEAGKHFADTCGVVFRKYNAGNCESFANGLAYRRKGSEPADRNIRTGGWTSFWMSDADEYSTLLHESGHAIFGLREEYAYPGSIIDKEDLGYHSNAFQNLTSCRRRTWHTNKDDCHEIPDSGGVAKADPDGDPMGYGGGDFGADCLRRAQCLMDGLLPDQCGRVVD